MLYSKWFSSTRRCSRCFVSFLLARTPALSSRPRAPGTARPRVGLFDGLSSDPNRALCAPRDLKLINQEPHSEAQMCRDDLSQRFSHLVDARKFCYAGARL